MGSIFVSYSHTDQKELGELRRFLAPLEKKGLIAFWDDSKIKPGDEWRREIDRALGDAGVALLLISQDFLNSSFIDEKELPYLIEKQANHALTVLPVFLKASNVTLVHPGLTEFQGFGSPDQPVSSLTKGQREDLYKKLSERLVELAEKPPAKPSPIHVPKIPINPESRDYTLLVNLHRQGDTLHADYRRPGEDPFLPLSRPWKQVEQAIAPMLRILDGGDPGKIRGLVDTAADHWGGVLFDVLFGDEPARHETVFRNAFWQPAPQALPNPVFAPLRLRIATEMPELSGLPWRLMTWDHRPLVEHGWIFLTGRETDPRIDVVTSAPCTVLLVVAAGADSDLADLLKQALLAIWPHSEPYIRVARSAAQIDNALAGQAPHFVYVHAPFEPRGDRTELLLADGPLPLRRLDELLRRHRSGAAALFLDIPKGSEEELGAIFDRAIPLVAWHRSPRIPEEPSVLPLAWLDAWLREGKDPVAALHQLCRVQGAPLDAHTLAFRADYRHWRTDIRVENLRERLTHLRLDREKQKGVTAKWLGELIASDRLRVMALAPYGAPGNRLRDVHHQLCHHAQSALEGRAAIKQIVLQFPESRENLYLEHELKQQLGLDLSGGETVKQLLHRHAPRYEAGRRPVLWLHWGVFGEGEGCQPALRLGELKTWLDFAGGFLTHHCPDQIRLVCSLAMQTGKPEIIQKSLYEKHRALTDPKFWLRILDPVGQVAEHELLDFLKDHSDGCPPGLCAELSELLIRETGGHFEPLVALIEPAEQTGHWHPLLDRLRRTHGVTQRLDDDETV